MKTAKYKKYKALLCAAAVLVLGQLTPVSVLGSSYDPAAKGSIQVELDDIGTNPGDVELRCYQVGTVTEEDSLRWQFTKEFETEKIDLNKLETAADYREAAALLAKTAGKSGAALRIGITDSQGMYTFKDLEQGVYLIVQENSAKYGVVEPFLIGIPYTERGQDWVYDVQTKTKGEHFPEKPKPEKPKPSKPTNNAKTGDEMPIAAAVIGLVLSAGVFAVGTKKRYLTRK